MIISGIEALADAMMKGAEAVGRGFTNPDDDWAPIGIGVMPSGEALVAPLDGATKEEMFLAILPRSIRAYSFQMVGLALPAWGVKVEDEAQIPDLMKHGIGGVSPELKQEMITITVQDKYELIVMSAQIARFPDAPPLLGAWDKSEDGDSWIAESIAAALQQV